MVIGFGSDLRQELTVYQAALDCILPQPPQRLTGVYYHLGLIWMF